jgi:hypothetical protein
MANDKAAAEAHLLAIARAAGLDRVVDLFPGDVLAAAQAVAQDRADLPTVDACAEPWPPMRMRSRP